MAKIKIDVTIPDYNIKYCDNVWHGSKCPYLQKYDYGFKQYCLLSGKDITKTKDNGNIICRPYGCRCKAKYLSC